MNNRYDARLFLYQSLLEIPAQVIMHDMYKRAGVRDVRTYGVMSIVGLGSYVACLKLGQAIYNTIHKGAQPDPNTEYYVSPVTEHTYNVGFEQYKHNVQPGADDPLKEYLSQANGYSKKYMDLVTTSGAARIGYGTIVADTKNPLYALAYGLTQPLCVTMEDAGVLK